MEGGSERFCFNLSKILQKRGHDIQIYTSRRDEPPHEVIEGIPCVFFRNYKHMLGLNPLAVIYRYLQQGIDWADVVHAHSYIYFLGNQVALYRKKRKFPFILHLHGGMSPISSEVYGFRAALAKILYNGTFGKWTIQSADKIIACSEHDKRVAIEKFGADPSRVDYIPNSIYVDNFYSNPVNPPIVIFVGRLTQLKGCHYFPRIIKSVHKLFSDAIFWIVGDGPLENYLKRELRSLPVKFWGRLPHQQIPEKLSQSSVMFLPSLMEGAPLVCLEALASQVPVVAFDVGGVSESIKNYETGFTVPVRDVKSMTKRIVSLLENDKDRKRMGRVGRKIVEKNHSWEKNTSRIESIYRSVV